MQWKLTISPSLRTEQQREIFKKHFIKKEPFGKISIHEMYITEMVENFLNTDIDIRIKNTEKEVICLPATIK